MKQHYSTVLKAAVKAKNFLYLRLEKEDGEGVQPHVYATSFAARHLATTLCEMMKNSVRAIMSLRKLSLVHAKYFVFDKTRLRNLVY